MGEAKRRAEAFAAGAPWRRPRVCPVRKCRSTRVDRLPAEHSLCRLVAEGWALGHGCRSGIAVPLDRCRECGAIWEPWPDDMPEDVVARHPCDNCAYRAGSPENQDREKFQELVDMATAHGLASFEESRRLPGFACHKGIPIRITEAGPEFDFEAAGKKPGHQMCAGFMRIVWANNGAATEKRAREQGEIEPGSLDSRRELSRPHIPASKVK